MDRCLPGWSQAKSPSPGRDPLGIQATSVRVYRELIPGLTNVTNRLRYYSFYCWVVHHYEEALHVDDQSQWRIFIRRAEALYALTSLLVNPEQADGLAGSQWAQGFLNTHKKGDIDLRRYTDNPGGAGQYLQAISGNFGQFYTSSMTAVGLLQLSAGVPLVRQPYGKAMAQGFSESVGNTVSTLLAAALSTGYLAFREAKIIGNAIHPNAIDVRSSEMRCLLDFLLARIPDTEEGTARRSSAWLLLDLVRHGVKLHDQQAIRRAFYHRVLPDGRPYERSGETIDLWRAYQANEICHTALEVWLNAVALELNTHPAGIAPGELLSNLLSEVFKSIEINDTWEQWARHNVLADIVEQDEMLRTILQSLRGPKEINYSALGAATRTLAILWATWGEGACGVRKALQRFGKDGRSLEDVLKSFDAQATQNARQALAKVLQEHVIDMHLRIAARKLALTSRFTYRFMLADGVLTDGMYTNYDFTNPRLGNLSRFLRDAKLYVGGHLTAAGKRFLDGTQPA